MRVTLGRVMTLHVLHAGDGYSYLTEQVASGDRLLEEGQSLADYYTVAGTPPGVWWGEGLTALADPDGLIGHDHPALAVGGRVDEAQMKALFGEGLHPNADALIAHLIEDGMSAEDAIKTARLGRKFPAFANEIPLLVRSDAAIKRYTNTHGHRPTLAERHAIERDVADELFTAERGRPPRTDRELASWMVNEKNKVRQPVAGFDLVFTPAKSVSVLWGLGEDHVRAAVTDAHHAAVTDALEWLQHEAIYTRTGTAGERQIDTRGITVAMFDHFDNRSGDPNFHTHATVSVKVQGTDGVWRSVDSKALHRHAVAASQRYNARIMAELRARLGVAVTARAMGEGKQPVLEVAGVDESLREMFSSRRTEIEARHDQLVREHRDRHGKMPSDRTSYALFQQATLDTREGKAPHRSLAQMRAGWREKAIEHLGSQAAVEAMIARALSPTAEHTPTFTHPDFEAARVVSRLEDRRATWTEPTLRAAVEAHIAPMRFATDDGRRAAIEDTITAARARTIALATPDFAATPAALQRANGESQLTRHGELLHTSNRILAAEGDLIEATRTPTAHIVTRDVIDAECARLAGESGRELNAGQRALVEHFTASGPLLRVGVGPAGAGKTTAMRAAARAWEATGRNVVALAPAKAAADLLGSEIGATGASVAAITYAYRGRLEHMGIPAGTLTDRFDAEIRPGTMLLVDEASMAATADLHALVQIARERGAIVCGLGDPYQLDAVETGGAFRLLADESHAPALTDVVRFGDDTAQAENSLKVRDGDHEAIALFTDRGWIHDGTTDELKTRIVADHLADTARGATGVLMAGTVEDVRDLNYAVQQAHRATGHADTATTTPLRDQHSAGVGDQIVTRTNDSSLRTVGGTRKGATVANGDLWTVQTVHPDGSLTVRHITHRGRITLPAPYVRKSVELGYAVTVHRAQGVTVDIARALHSVTANKRMLYVETTRGATANHLYVPTDQNVAIDTEGVHVDPTGRAPDATEVLRAALDNDGGHRAATTELRDALAAADDPERLATHYRAAHTLLRDAYITHVIDTALPASMVATMREAHPDSHARLRAALADLHDHGVNIVPLLRDAEDLHTARDAAAVLVARLADVERPDRSPDALPPLPPRHPGADHELADYAAAAADEHNRATHTRTGLRGSLIRYQRSIEALTAARVEVATAHLPRDIQTVITTDESAAKLSAKLHRAQLAGLALTDVVDTAARDIDAAGDEVSSDTLITHIDTHLPAIAAERRGAWLAEHPTVAAAFPAAAEADSAAWRQLVDDLRARQILAGTDPAHAAALLARRVDDAQTATATDLVKAWRPDHTLGAIGRFVGAPEWITPPPLGAVDVDPALAAAAAEHYRQLRADTLDAGRAAAADHPTWTQELGPVPEADAGRDRADWVTAAGQIAAYRAQYDVTDEATALGQDPEASAGAQRRAHQHAAAHLEQIQAAEHAEAAEEARLRTARVARDDGAQHRRRIGM